MSDDEDRPPEGEALLDWAWDKGLDWDEATALAERMNEGDDR